MKMALFSLALIGVVLYATTVYGWHPVAWVCIAMCSVTAIGFVVLELRGD